MELGSACAARRQGRYLRQTLRPRDRAQPHRAY